MAELMARENVFAKVFGLVFVQVVASALLLISTGYAADVGYRVVVRKSKLQLSVYRDDVAMASFAIALGGQPLGHKQTAGDQRTPEGRYVLDWRNAKSEYHKSIHNSYPNAADRRAAAQRGADPGGAVMIHGQRNGFGWLAFIVQRFNWTDGCIAVSNPDMDRLWNALPIGTPIDILP